MITVKIMDAIIGDLPSMTMNGENAGDKPKQLIWDRNPEHVQEGDTVIFTDGKMQDALDSRYEKVRKIGMLIEPFSFRQEPYDFAWEYKDFFHAIFTHYKPFVDSGRPFYFYPWGGSWIRLWGYFKKSKLVSLLTSDKYVTYGHKMRHEIAQRFMSQVDVMGRPYTEYLRSKVPALRPYRYSIIVENCNKDYYFSEKLIDCISQGTIPIYWGMPSIGDVFDMDGIITFSHPDQLPSILNMIGPEDYARRQTPARRNLSKAHRFICAENWITERYIHLLR